jgi:hypothetical protein
MNFLARVQGRVSRYFKAALLSSVQEEGVIADWKRINSEIPNLKSEVVSGDPAFEPRLATGHEKSDLKSEGVQETGNLPLLSLLRFSFLRKSKLVARKQGRCVEKDRREKNSTRRSPRASAERGGPIGRY